MRTLAARGASAGQGPPSANIIIASRDDELSACSSAELETLNLFNSKNRLSL